MLDPSFPWYDIDFNEAGLAQEEFNWPGGRSLAFGFGPHTGNTFPRLSANILCVLGFLWIYGTLPPELYEKGDLFAVKQNDVLVNWHYPHPY